MVNQNEISEMARLIAMMNANVSFDEGRAAPPALPFVGDPMSMGEALPFDPNETFGSIHDRSYSQGAVAAPPVMVSEDTEAMKNILQAFYSASGPAAALAERSTTDRALREAMTTEKTKRGTRVGNWEIRVYENDEGLKSYDVARAGSDEVIAENLSLYDAAYALTRFLNEGFAINSPKVRTVLNAEAQYSKSREDAARYHTRLQEASDRTSQRYMVCEDRYHEALNKAKEARTRVMKLVRV